MTLQESERKMVNEITVKPMVAGFLRLPDRNPPQRRQNHDREESGKMRIPTFEGEMPEYSEGRRERQGVRNSSRRRSLFKEEMKSLL
jgi:hypothetical protein